MDLHSWASHPERRKHTPDAHCANARHHRGTAQVHPTSVMAGEARSPATQTFGRRRSVDELDTGSHRLATNERVIASDRSRLTPESRHPPSMLLALPARRILRWRAKLPRRHNHRGNNMHRVWPELAILVRGQTHHQVTADHDPIASSVARIDSSRAPRAALSANLTYSSAASAVRRVVSFAISRSVSSMPRAR